MFCQNCGQEITANDAFCPNCGQPVKQADTGYANPNPNPNPNLNSNFNQNQNQNQNFNNSVGGNAGSNAGGGDKKDWKAYVTPENIERFAPAATIAPLAMALVVGIVFNVILFILGRIPVIGMVLFIVSILLKVVFCVASLAATAGLVYVIVTKNKVSSVWAWLTTVATLFAFISCLCIAFSWGIPAWIFGILSVVCGIDMFGRITLAGNPIDTQINPSISFAAYKEYYRLYKEKYPAKEKQPQPQQMGGQMYNVPAPVAPAAPIDRMSESYFDGKGIELFGYWLLGSLLISVTCGIATPWVICMVYKWRMDHTYINGRKLTFNGTGISLLGHWILWEILTIITCGIYGYFTYVAVKKWELSHTYLDGEPIIPDAKTSYFDGNSFEYLGYSILGGLLTTITCGIFFPWYMCILQTWESSHSVVNSHRMKFEGKGLAFLGQYLLILLLTVITCGIYLPWGICKMNRYITKNIYFEN